MHAARRYSIVLLSMLIALALMITMVGIVGAQDPITFSNLTPAPESTVQAGVETTIAANITSDSPITSVNVFLDGTPIDVEVLGPSETQLSFFTGRILSAGPHTVRATATNQAGESAEVTWSFTAAAGAQPDRPTFSRFVPAPNSTVPVGTTTIGANITSDSAITDIRLFLDGQQIEVAEALGPSPEQIAIISARDLSAGVHTVRVIATDQDGDTGEVEWSFTSVAQLPRTGGMPLGMTLPLLIGLGAAAAGAGLRLRLR